MQYIIVKRRDLSLLFYFLIIDMEMEDILFSNAIASGLLLLIKPGDTFLSKVTGKLVMCCDVVVDDDHTRKSCSCTKCVYNECSSYIRYLRLIEAGHCIPYFRKDNKYVYFKEVESLYEISQETKELLKTLYSLSAIPANEKIEYMRLLLDIEYAVYKC